jgi:hypothetical protein
VLPANQYIRHGMTCRAWSVTRSTMFKKTIYQWSAKVTHSVQTDCGPPCACSASRCSPVQLPDARGTLVLMPPLLVRLPASLCPGLSAALGCCCMLPADDCSGRTAPWLFTAVGGAPAAPPSAVRPAVLLLLAPSPSRPAGPDVCWKPEAGSSCSSAPAAPAAAAGTLALATAGAAAGAP